MPVFVNDTEIDDNTVFSEMQYHSAPSMEEARDAAAQALVVKELLPFDMVEERIRDYLHTRSIREGIRSYILHLAESARIFGFDISAL